MSDTKETLNIVLPYCGEATGIDQTAWIESCAKHKPTQLRSRLVVISSSSCDTERYRAFTQRAKEVFDEFVEIVKFKPSPNNLEEVHKFTSYCFMTAWPNFQVFGAGIYIDPEWAPNKDYWADDFIAAMRVDQSEAIALGIKYAEQPSEISGNLGYSANFFSVFYNYKKYIKDSILLNRLGWEFKKFGCHASADNYPFIKTSTVDKAQVDAFAKAPEPAPEEVAVAELVLPVFGDTSEEDLKASLGASDNMPSMYEKPDKPVKKVAKKAAKKATKKKRAKRRTKAQIASSK